MKSLFAPLNSPYYLYAPAYAGGAEEARVLHHLCHALNLAGEEAYVTEPGSAALRTPQLSQAQRAAHMQAGRRPIVIYPDSTVGNPLGASNVVRLLLAADAQYDADEMAVAWHPGHVGLNAARLAVPLADDAGYAREREAFERQLQDFIVVSQRRFGQVAGDAAPAVAQAPVTAVRDDSPARNPAPTARPAAAAQLVRGGLARPLARPATPSSRTVAPLPAAATPPSFAAAPLPVPKRKKRLVVYSVESTWSPCPQIRLIRPFAHLQDEWELVWGIRNGQLQSDYLSSADLIVMHRFTPGLMPLPVLEAIFASPVPIVYESDDLLNEIPHDHPEAQQGASWKAGIEYAVRHAKAVVVSTEFLAAKYRELNPAVHVLPNYIDFELFHRAVPENQAADGRINIGLLGSSIQPSNFALVDDALRALVERYGQRLHIDFVGWECPKGWENHPQATFHTFVHQYVDYAAQLRQWNWDIALVPLASDEYNQCKSYIKWLDYSAAGIASVFSDVSVYNEVVTHDRTGLLMPPSGDAWLAAVSQLIESPEKRHALARAGQQAVHDDFDLRDKATLYNHTYGRLAAQD